MFKFFLFIAFFSLIQTDNVCLNGGSLIKIKTLNENFNCKCPIGFYGSNCEYTLKDQLINKTFQLQSSTMCGKNGQLTQLFITEHIGIFYCACKKGFMGSFCKQEMNGLDTLKFENVPFIKKTWTDSFCFSTQNCNNHGECLKVNYLQKHVSFCNCQHGFSGPDCSEQTEDAPKNIIFNLI